MYKKENLFILTGAGFSAPYLEDEDEKLTTIFLTKLITDPAVFSNWYDKS